MRPILKEKWISFGRRWLKPLYHASVSTVAGLIFGLLPLWTSWIQLLLRGDFGEGYKATLSKGDILMVASALAGSAVVLGFRKRDPETLPLQELFGVIGICIVLFCSTVAIEASPDFHIFANQFTANVVFHLTVAFVPICTAYAIFMTWQAERSHVLHDMAALRKTYDVNGQGLKLTYKPKE